MSATNLVFYLLNIYYFLKDNIQHVVASILDQRLDTVWGIHRFSSVYSIESNGYSKKRWHACCILVLLHLSTDLAFITCMDPLCEVSIRSNKTKLTCFKNIGNLLV